MEIINNVTSDPFILDLLADVAAISDWEYSADRYYDNQMTASHPSDDQMTASQKTNQNTGIAHLGKRSSWPQCTVS